MIDVVKCIRAEGLKTALLTNNWFNAGQNRTFIPIDLSLFDVVCAGRIDKEGIL